MASHFSTPPSTGAMTCFAFCDSSDNLFHPQRQKGPRSDDGGHTDAELAQEISGLSFEERNEIIEDIHGVSPIIEETEDFVTAKLEAMMNSLKYISSRNYPRSAWDRAVFLRPSLESDREHHLVFLRARRFDPMNAAILLLKFYQVRRQVFGEEHLIHLVPWGALTPQDQAFMTSGIRNFIPKNSSEGGLSRLAYFSLGRVNLSVHSPESIARCLLIPFDWQIRNIPEVQRKGANYVIDVRGEWKTPGMLLLQTMSKVNPLIESTPLHCSAFHILCEQETSGWSYLLKRLQGTLTRRGRVRLRIHFGSWTEIQYSLRTYGIDFGTDPLLQEGYFSKSSLESEVSKWKQLESLWRESEAAFQAPTSSYSLYPNPQDILLGSNKTVVPSWSGNVAYKTLIQAHAHIYLVTEGRRQKTEMTLQVIEKIQTELKARFLVRTNTGWETAETSHIQLKISQALRNEARLLAKKMKATAAADAMATK